MISKLVAYTTKNIEKYPQVVNLWQNPSFLAAQKDFRETKFEHFSELNIETPEIDQEIAPALVRAIEEKKMSLFRHKTGQLFILKEFDKKTPLSLTTRLYSKKNRFITPRIKVSQKKYLDLFLPGSFSTLATAARNNPRLVFDNFKILTKSYLEAFHFKNEEPILHKDLHDQNLLVKVAGGKIIDVKYIDFKEIGPPRTHANGLKDRPFQHYLNMDLSGLELAKTFNTGLPLGSFFQDTDLTNTVFTGRTLDYQLFINCRLNNADFQKTYFEGGIFLNSNLKETHWNYIFLALSMFQGTDLQHANFSNADISNCIFQKADLRHASFAGARINKVHFEEVDFRKAIFNTYGFDNSKLLNCKFPLDVYEEFKSLKFKIIKKSDHLIVSNI
jgi:uncharacterized protein YjbI with pentapeptide repeats